MKLSSHKKILYGLVIVFFMSSTVNAIQTYRVVCDAKVHGGKYKSMSKCQKYKKIHDDAHHSGRPISLCSSIAG